MDRKTFKINPDIQSIDIPGVRVRDRSLQGANLIHDISLFEILYELTAISGDRKYEEEANKALKYFFNTGQSPATGLMCWGEHLYWDFIREDCGYYPNYDYHETSAWPFWEKAYEINAQACWTFALSEWDHQIHDKHTGDFSRHARYTKHETFSGFDFPRYAGQMIERWIRAYQYTEYTDHQRREELLTAIMVVFNRMVENMEISKSGHLIAGRSPQGDHINLVWLTNNLELARCLEVAASLLEKEIADQMLAFALRQDTSFLNAPHKLDSLGGGFAVTLHAQTGMPRSRSMNKPYTSTWSSGYGYGTHANTANTCYSRYLKLKPRHTELADRYRKLTLNAANKYLSSDPDTSELLKPNEFSNVIGLMLNCHNLTGKENYLERAVHFAKMGVKLFFDDDSPLPKATNQHDHYESITGGPAFIFQLLKLHLVMT